MVIASLSNTNEQHRLVYVQIGELGKYTDVQIGERGKQRVEGLLIFHRFVLKIALKMAL